MGVERVHFHRIDNIQSRCSGKKVTGAFDGIAFEVCFVNADFHSLRSFFVRRHSQSCGLYGPVGYRIPPAGFGATHKIERCPQTLRHAAYFLCSPGADGSKNNCDLTGFDLNGDWIFQSSHAPVKTAIIILLSFRFPTCITSQVKLYGNLGNYSCFIFKEPLASFARHAACCGPGFPGPQFRFTVLPVCRASMPCSPAGA